MNPELSPSNTTIRRLDKDVYGGWLSKRGRGRGLVGFFGVFRPWAIRYITVNNVSSLLTYYETEEDGENRTNERGSGLKAP